MRGEYISNKILKRRTFLTDDEVLQKIQNLTSKASFKCGKYKEIFDPKVQRTKKRKKDCSKITSTQKSRFSTIINEEKNKTNLSKGNLKNIINICPIVEHSLGKSFFTKFDDLNNDTSYIFNGIDESQKNQPNFEVYNYSNMLLSKHYKINYEVVRRKLIENPKISIAKLTEFYNSSFPDDKISRETLRKLIKREFTYKSFYLKNTIIKSKEYQSEINIYLKKFFSILENNYDIVYTDESKFTTSHKKHIWVLRNISNFNEIPVEDFSINISYNLILSVLKDKIIHFEIYEENNNSEVFTSYFERLCLNLSTNNYDISKLYFYVDNSRIHHSKDFRRFILESKKIKILYSIRYTPELNLCEYLFSYLKLFFYKTQFVDGEQFCKILNDEIIKLNEDKLKILGYYQHLLNQITNFLNKTISY